MKKHAMQHKDIADAFNIILFFALISQNKQGALLVDNGKILYLVFHFQIDIKLWSDCKEKSRCLDPSTKLITNMKKILESYWLRIVPYHLHLHNMQWVIGTIRQDKQNLSSQLETAS